MTSETGQTAPRPPDEAGCDGENGPRFAPITHFTLYERVYEELRKAIMAGRFASGDSLTIRGVAQQFGTSAMPVREALRRLATEGAVEVLANRTIRIPLMTKERLDELHTIRVALESEAARLAASRATEAELQAIESLNNDFIETSRASDVGKTLAANQRFHFAVYAAARAPTLLSLIGMLWLQAGPWLLQPLRRSRRQDGPRDYMGASFAHHLTLVQALRDRNGERAAEAIRSDIVDAAKHFLVDGEAPFDERSGSAA
ncbi:GntR family transcriptional regulator [Roseiarcus fermentans]|uniref:GntR family transcriptional regulator n=1 Tax=Roseiarcus fermentans TaxID=1473586 RepID=A0A366FJV3_9HYPH|nr:GntR family transcriptional regulator [Roseiarcus fermentans]RBP14005.1 GntR family transcriptional regulator [Roseiarcus fermentans]